LQPERYRPTPEIDPGGPRLAAARREPPATPGAPAAATPSTLDWLKLLIRAAPADRPAWRWRRYAYERFSSGRTRDRQGALSGHLPSLYNAAARECRPLRRGVPGTMERPDLRTAARRVYAIADASRPHLLTPGQTHKDSAGASSGAGQSPCAATVGNRTVRFDGCRWTYREGFEEVLTRLPKSAWENPEAQGWQLIKNSARREVWRARLGSRYYYLKYYDRGARLAGIKELLGFRAWEHEWRSGLYALQAEIAAVRPAAFTDDLRRNGRRFGLLVTQAEEPAYPLNEFWQQLRTDDNPVRQSEATRQLIEHLAEMIARAHQSGFEHRDMHAANILVCAIAPGRYRPLFVDLHSARLGVPISDRAVVRNLAQLNQWFRQHSSITTRLRFLRAYCRWRNEYEVALPFGRPLKLSFRGLVAALAYAAERHAERLGNQRDRRAGRDGRYFARLELDKGWRGMAVVRVKHMTAFSPASRLTLEPSWWRQVLSDPLRWFEAGDAESCKQSHSAVVCRALLPHPTGPIPVVMKRPRARNGWRGLRHLLPPSRSRRAWGTGHALLNRRVPTARPLAVLERRVGPLVLDSLLVTEAIPGAIDLERYLRRCYGSGDGHAELTATAYFHAKRRLIERLVQHIRRLHEHGFVHRDCKAGNILVAPPPYEELFWIDLDGIRRGRGGNVSPRALRALATLHVSLLGIPGLTRTDRVRFLKSYAARFGADENAWRRLWHELVPIVGRRLRQRDAHRRWKLARYGRI